MVRASHIVARTQKLVPQNVGREFPAKTLKTVMILDGRFLAWV